MGHRSERAKIPLVVMARFKQLPILKIRVRSRDEVEQDALTEQAERKAEAARLLAKLISGPVYGDGELE